MFVQLFVAFVYGLVHVDCINFTAENYKVARDLKDDHPCWHGGVPKPCFFIHLNIENAKYEEGHVRKPGDETYKVQIKESDPVSNDVYAECTGSMYGGDKCSLKARDEDEVLFNMWYLKFYINAEYAKGEDQYRCILFPFSKARGNDYMRLISAATLTVKPDGICSLQYYDRVLDETREAFCQTCCWVENCVIGTGIPYVDLG
ncbi:unnamed protein product, partial [Mesorhabditis spiculigera]